MKNFFLSLSNENKGFIFGFVGIIIFSITPVATKIALGYNNSQLSAEFITFGRSALAGNLALLYLFFFRKKIPKLKYLFNFSIIAFCLSVVFPLTLSFGLIYSTSIHAGVILAFLPLATAIFASFYFKQKASKSFWLCAFFGSIIVVIYILLHNENSNTTFEISHYDIEINIISWIGFLYVAIFSQWIGFFAWYKGLDLGGAVRVSQIQLLMPFFTFAFSIYILGETLDFLTIIFSVAIILLIYLSRKTAVSKK
ncbi:MAG: DMT family transporter [Proteobacteria bacterium]|nr:DMT family transporter [Pseudomonadota bacterium]